MLTWSLKHLSPTNPHYRLIFALIFVGAPLVLPTVIDITLHTKCISHRFSLLCAWATSQIRSKNDHDACTRYASPEAEERYWALAKSWEKRLASSNARSKADAQMLTKIPLIMSYTPALLPRYRTHRIRCRDTTTSATLAGEGEYYLSARVFYAPDLAASIKTQE
ncbi:hypothetical protein D9615_009644 [Tricholomella constricta]|uniref:Uncharacterized protein n=1 Tax=Tricholomella constricta TaxID=117010 RepID=A0A8H5GUV4_9AGAR|nr:hypothetical protein D9615_009644 [Tricholomella constricta]